jgi:tripartite-type tricarboxylate transporter receptor subunit TctC
MPTIVSSFICAPLSAVALCLPLAVLGQVPSYPTKPITIVVGSAPGGSNDVFARALGRRLQESLGQTVIVDNRPSDGGVLANSVVARAQPDGYTLVVVSSTFTTGAAVRTNLQYDAAKDFKPVAMLARGPMLVTVRTDSPFKSIQEFVAAAKAQPAKLNYGTSGAGSINHFATELFAQGAGIKLTHIPYKGMGPATTDLLGGQIDLLVASAPSILQQVKGGRARALAVTSSSRSPVAPELPTLEEVGYKGSTVDLWWGLLAPAKTPQPVIDRLNVAVNREIQSPEMKSFFLNEGAEPAPLTPAEFVQYIATEISRWKSIAKTADIKPE